VRQLVEEAPKSIRYLMRLGAAFDPEQGGTDIALTREGGHSHNRIVHSGGDRSGAEVQRTLDESAIGAGVEVMGHAFALDLVLGTAADGEPQAVGVRIGRTDEHGVLTSVGIVTARAVVIASGGYGQVFASTSNPPAVTGDGVAMALRAGLAVTDVEFVQFHPTVMWRGPDARGQQALVSEAVRGEGAILYDGAGERVMVGVHPLEDLAPRDVVAAAISERMAEAPGGIDDHVFLDATHLGERFHDPVPVDHRRLPRDRTRPGRRPHPGRAGGALRLRGHPRRSRRSHVAARSLRRRRGVGHRRPRCQPAGVEQPHRVGGGRDVGRA
jgi:L-aspartate oxidase